MFSSSLSIKMSRWIHHYHVLLCNSSDVVLCKWRYFQTVATAISDKADTGTTYSNIVVNSFLDAKVDDTEMTNYYATTATIYPRTVKDSKFTNINNGASDALNTLKELSDALGSDANFSTTVLNKINSKSNQVMFSSPLLLDFKPANPELRNVFADVYSKTESDSLLNSRSNRLNQNGSK